jgi:hypothetical protein
MNRYAKRMVTCITTEIISEQRLYAPNVFVQKNYYAVISSATC